MERLDVLRPEEPEGWIMKKVVQLKSAPNNPGQTKPAVRKLRCAVYTRKSSEEGLDQEFNSLHAQRESCESYIASQRGEGWVLVPDQYDDGGISGATLERPALKRLLADIEAHRIDVVVVYKIDRLSRSLMDFSKLAETFDGNTVSFVSVTQQFNTSTSMGRLTLNMLLSFAQFEREVIGERIRDKIAASRRKGMWMGGFVPLGYDVKDRKLLVNQTEAAVVRKVFEGFIKTGSATVLVRALREEGVCGKRGRLIDKGYVYQLLNNRVYVGDAVHKGTAYPGEHQAIVTKAIWDKVHGILANGTRRRAASTRAQTPALLKGLIFGSSGCAMTPTHTRKGGRLYRYYIASDLLKHDAPACTVRRVPAAEIEGAVIDQVRGLLRTPEIIVRTWRAGRRLVAGLEVSVVREALQRLDPVWEELFPAEQARVIQLLVERVDVTPVGLDIRLRTEGLANLTSELNAVRPEQKVA
jgi:DNA invertase Pin-like site-specific DNA recombinase